MTNKKSKSKKNGLAPIDAEQLKALEAKIKATAMEVVPINSIFPNPKNAKRHPEHQITLLAENIRKFGFTNPVGVDEAWNILFGHGRLLAARRLGMTAIPIIRMLGLSPTEKIALALADNKLSELGEADEENLASNLRILVDAPDLTFDLELTGFSTVETDNILYGDKPKKKDDAADTLPAINENEMPICRVGDLWKCGPHALFCGDAQLASSYRVLLGEERAAMMFTDPPYNVPIRGHVSRRDDVREFVMASGEMSRDQFVAFLRNVMLLAVDNVREGAVMYTCIDWAHYPDLLQATHRVLGEPRNLIVWAKDNAGMGSFYRSQHELIPAFVAPGAAPTNNFGLGSRGRYRTNVWKYPGVNTLGSERDATLAMHPTVKPVALVADAIRDCSHRGEIILDPFGGSGTTLIAAHKTGRRSRLLELDPLYCDVIIRRFEAFTGEQAVLAETGETFSEIGAQRGTIQVTK